MVPALARPAAGHQGLQLLQGGQAGRHRAVGAVPVRGGVGGREPGGSGGHRLADDPGHLADLVVGGLPLEGGVAHDPAPHGGVADVAGHVHAEPAPAGGQELGEGLEVPGQAVEGGGRHALDPGEHLGDVGPVGFLGGRHREAAVAGQDGGHPVEAGRGGVGLEGELGVVVRVRVDDPGGHDQAGGVHGAGGRALLGEADGGDLAVLDHDVGPTPGQAGAVDQRAADHARS